MPPRFGLLVLRGFSVPSGPVPVLVTLQVAAFVPPLAEVRAVDVLDHAGLVTTAEGAKVHDVVTLVALQTLVSTLSHSRQQQQHQEHRGVLKQTRQNQTKLTDLLVNRECIDAGGKDDRKINHTLKCYLYCNRLTFLKILSNHKE